MAPVTAALWLVCGAAAQHYVIATVVAEQPAPTAAAGTSVPFRSPSGVAVDAAGNVYFTTEASVWKLDAKGLVTRVAGNGREGYSGDGGPATSAQLNFALAVAVDSQGNLFIADTKNYRIRKVSPDGVIATVAGNGTRGYSGDGGPATTAQLRYPVGVTADSHGNLFVADQFNYRIRKVSPEGVITTVAGNGDSGYSGDGGPATSAQLLSPEAVTADSQGNLFIVDTSDHRIRKVSPGGDITTFAGNGTRGYSGDGGPATSAQLRDPRGVSADARGNVFIADSNGASVRKVSPGGIITTVAGSGAFNYAGDGGPATSAGLAASGMAADPGGNLFIADWFNNRIRKVSPNGIITTVAGNGTPANSGDGGPATSAILSGGWNLAVDGSGNLFVADFGHNRVRKISPNGTISTVAGNGTPGNSGDGGPATSARLSQPDSLAVDWQGALFIGENAYVRRVSPTGTIATVAGSGRSGDPGDGGPAISAHLGRLVGLAVDGRGNLFLADSFDSRVRKVSPDGIITTVAGTGTRGYSGDGGPAARAQLNYPLGLAVDPQGNLFIADSFNSCIRKVSLNGIVTTVAGTGVAGYSGDGAPATSAQLAQPAGLAVDAQGNLWIADRGNYRIRMVSLGGIITTMAGDGTIGYSGDGGSALFAQLLGPTGLAIDGQGNVYVADAGNIIRRLRPANQ
jgi:sugar lactone lactonase YvrE